MNQSVVKALQLLDLFTADQHEYSLSDIHRKTNMSKPTVYRLLSSLEHCGFLKKVRYSEQDIRYQLGLKLLELGNIVSERLELRKVALPHMERLRDEINEIVHLTIVDGDEATYIEKVESSQAIRLYTRVGKSSPLYVGSGPKLLFAYMAGKDRAKILKNLELKPFTKNTIADPVRLQEELETIRKQGFAISYGEQDEDTIGISYPIRDYTEAVVAALTVSGPSNRFEQDRENYIKELLKKTANNISHDLGYTR